MRYNNLYFGSDRSFYFMYFNVLVTWTLGFYLLKFVLCYLFLLIISVMHCYILNEMYCREWIYHMHLTGSSNLLKKLCFPFLIIRKLLWGNVWRAVSWRLLWFPMLNIITSHLSSYLNLLSLKLILLRLIEIW